VLGYACFQNLIVAAVARHSLKSTQCVSGIVLNGADGSISLLPLLRLAVLQAHWLYCMARH